MIVYLMRHLILGISSRWSYLLSVNIITIDGIILIVESWPLTDWIRISKLIRKWGSIRITIPTTTKLCHVFIYTHFVFRVYSYSCSWLCIYIYRTTRLSVMSINFSDSFHFLVSEMFFFVCISHTIMITCTIAHYLDPAVQCKWTKSI